MKTTKMASFCSSSLSSASTDSMENQANSQRSSIKTAQEVVDKLYDFRDRYFERNGIYNAHRRNDDIDHEMKRTLELLENLKDQYITENAAMFYYLKGRALNIGCSYSSTAHEALSKACKANPTMFETWNELGESYCKKKDMEAAKNCFESALKHSMNKVSLRKLSMVLRQLGKSKDDRLKNVEESLEKAREAVQLDLADGESWYVLGNAYLSAFFVMAQSPKFLKQCMTSYNQAEKDIASSTLPDLQWNKATALKYEEEYEQALQGLSKAQTLDPLWPEPKEAEQQLLDYLIRVQDLVDKKGRLKSKRLQQLLQNLGSLTQVSTALGPYNGGAYIAPGGSRKKLEQIVFKQLQSGINVEKVILGKVVCSITDGGSIPFTICLVDKEETCFSATIYNLAQGRGVIIGDSVAIPEPFVQDVSFHYKEKKFDYRSIRIDNPTVLVVNGRKFGRDKVAASEIFFQNLT